MDTTNFGEELASARNIRGVSLNELAKKMTAFGAGKGQAANLSRMEKGNESPSEARVKQIVDALASIAGDSNKEKDRLLSKLMTAADIGGISDVSQISYLRRKAEKRLASSKLLQAHEIETILDHIGIPTIKRIAEEDDESLDMVELLQDISQELNRKTNIESPPTYTIRGEEVGFDADHSFGAGPRAAILVEGELKPNHVAALLQLGMAIMHVIEGD